MKKLFVALTIFLSGATFVLAQPCGTAQSLSASQQIAINNLLVPLDTALKNEDLFEIDSLSTVLKNIYDTQGGIPDVIEPYYELDANTNLLGLPEAIILSRALIAADSMVYVDLWKAGKGMSPPDYQPNSIFLRAAAEIAAGLLKIAAAETDLSRKSLYQSWAIKTLDSLATMQLPSGAFPFPDLRPYGDPVFSSIIQDFLDWCGDDSVDVLVDGWIIDDKGTGEFKFDAGVIANAYFEAYKYTGNINYKLITIAIGDYLKPLKFNLNYNYNSFVALGLTRAYELTNDTSYLNRAIENLRYAVYPGQIENGRWVDGHNANSRYHSIIIQNSVTVNIHTPEANIYKNVSDSMMYAAVQNLTAYSYTCNSATGYRWLMKALWLNIEVITPSLQDSVTQLVGQHINQSAINGKYLDVPTMGEYFELLDYPTAINNAVGAAVLITSISPNPATALLNISIQGFQENDYTIEIIDLTGRTVEVINAGHILTGTYNCQLNISAYNPGIYIVQFKISNQIIKNEMVVIQ